MSKDDLKQLSYLPNGELNAPFILANANLLYQKGEIELSASLFRLIKNHKKYAHCGHYGLGKCYFSKGNFETAYAAFEKALSLSRKSYIAIAMLETLKKLDNLDLLERLALEFAREFATDLPSVEKFKTFYEQALLNHNN